MRAFAQLALAISQDNDQHKMLMDLESFLDDDAHDKFHSEHLTLLAGATDQVFAFGGVTSAAAVLILAWDTVSVKLNGIGAPAVQVRPIAADADGTPLSVYQKEDQPGIVLWYGKVDSIHLTNPSGTDTATVFVALLGNAT